MGVLKDTEITLMDGTTKKIEDLNSEDELLSCSISGISNKGRERDSIRWSNNNPELEKYKAKLDASWIDGQHIYMIINNNLHIKIRSTGRLIKAKANINKSDTEVDLSENETGISPGQACVFYSTNKFGDKVLGGGWITKTVNKYLST